MAQEAFGELVVLPAGFDIENGGQTPILEVPRGCIAVRATNAWWRDHPDPTDGPALTNGEYVVKIYRAAETSQRQSLTVPVDGDMMMLPPGTKIWADGLIAVPRYADMTDDQITQALSLTNPRPRGPHGRRA